VLQITFRI